MLDLENIDQGDARLVQIGLRELGLYSGTTAGRPGPKTIDAYARYREGIIRADSGDGEIANDLGGRLATIAASQVGTKEQGGNNRGPEIRKYQDADWLDGTGYPWCASFVCWCVRELGRKTQLPFTRPRTAAAWDFERWAREEGLVLVKPSDGDIRRGDIVIFRFSHIGIAVRDADRGTVVDVEGNTDDDLGGRDGDGVYTKIRSLELVRSHIRLELAS